MDHPGVSTQAQVTPELVEFQMPPPPCMAVWLVMNNLLPSAEQAAPVLGEPPGKLKFQVAPKLVELNAVEEPIAKSVLPSAELAT